MEVPKNFFERLVCAIEKEKIEQKVIIRYHKQRYESLTKKIKNINYIKIFNNFNPLCQFYIEKILRSLVPI